MAVEYLKISYVHLPLERNTSALAELGTARIIVNESGYYLIISELATRDDSTLSPFRSREARCFHSRRPGRDLCFGLKPQQSFCSSVI